MKSTSDTESVNNCIETPETTAGPTDAPEGDGPADANETHGSDDGSRG